MEPRVGFLVFVALTPAVLHAQEADDAAPVRMAVSPYEEVDWSSVSHYRADLHVHTIQSDGCHTPAEVVEAYHAAGFSILALTDHDTISPNGCPLHENASVGQIEAGVFASSHSPFPDPRPENFPANTTWPWPDFGAPAPESLGMVGIEGAELTCGPHRNVYFADYGVLEPCPTIDEQTRAAAGQRGLMVLNHPEGRLKEWYYELFRSHSADYLIGMELSRSAGEAAALWDQLLADLMPARPVWGFANSDMHFFSRMQFAFTVLLLDRLSAGGVREAMRTGSFYSVVASTNRDLRSGASAPYDGSYPEPISLTVDHGEQRISLEARNYDEILWVSGRSTWRYSIDPDTGIAWPPGEVVGRGSDFDYGDFDLNYVRAELIGGTGDARVRVLLNPVALTIRR